MHALPLTPALRHYCERIKSYPAFLAHRLAATNYTTVELADLFGCTEDAVLAIGMCRNPLNAAECQHIEQYAQIRPMSLTSLLGF